MIPLAQKKKKDETQPITIPDEYILISADLSLKRPGFCVLHVGKKDDKVVIEQCELVSVDNKTKTKPRGQLLQEIATAFIQLLQAANKPVFLVREQCINNCGGKMAHGSTAARTGISAVVGVMDLLSWEKNHLVWEEFYPTTIKKTLTGNGKAEKSQVADALKEYLGQQNYKNDDESDAAAVAVVWLIHHNQIKQIIQEDTPSE